MTEIEAARPVFEPERMQGSAERDPRSAQVIGCAIEAHRHPGPGRLASAYERCLSRQLTNAGLAIRREVPLPVREGGITLEAAHRLDIVVENALIAVLKAVEVITALHKAQWLAYLRLGGIRRGLLLNFCVPRLRDGIVRLVA